MRSLAVDFGFKDIGIAVGDVDSGIGSPRKPLPASGSLKRDAASVWELAKKEEVDVFLVGLPVEEHGREGRMARICRMLGDHLQELGARVEYVDESFTSMEAEQRMIDAGVQREPRQEKIHGEAAMLIFERYSYGAKETI